MPQTFVDVIELLVPELQKRGIFWKDFHVPGGTYRENLYEMAGQHEPLPDHPAAAMIWRSPEEVERLAKSSTVAASGAAERKDSHEQEEEVFDPVTMQFC